MSVRNFDRRFRNATGEAPSIYIQKLRVEKAKRLLETTNDTFEEITSKVGYEDTRSFRRLFYKHTALSSTTYRAKYGVPTGPGLKVPGDHLHVQGRFAPGAPQPSGNGNKWTAERV